MKVRKPQFMRGLKSRQAYWRAKRMLETGEFARLSEGALDELYAYGLDRRYSCVGATIRLDEFGKITPESWRTAIKSRVFRGTVN